MARSSLARELRCVASYSLKVAVKPREPSAGVDTLRGAGTATPYRPRRVGACHKTNASIIRSHPSRHPERRVSGREISATNSEIQAPSGRCQAPSERFSSPRFFRFTPTRSSSLGMTGRLGCGQGVCWIVRVRSAPPNAVARAARRVPRRPLPVGLKSFALLRKEERSSDHAGPHGLVIQLIHGSASMPLRIRGHPGTLLQPHREVRAVERSHACAIGALRRRPCRDADRKFRAAGDQLSARSRESGNR